MLPYWRLRSSNPPGPVRSLVAAIHHHADLQAEVPKFNHLSQAPSAEALSALWVAGVVVLRYRITIHGVCLASLGGFNDRLYKVEGSIMNGYLFEEGSLKIAVGTSSAVNGCKEDPGGACSDTTDKAHRTGGSSEARPRASALRAQGVVKHGSPGWYHEWSLRTCAAARPTRFNRPGAGDSELRRSLSQKLVHSGLS
eukprot:765437-Hanusia_phi.AAC.1